MSLESSGYFSRFALTRERQSKETSMRMFLVGMCDIFLLLYLTTLSQVDARHLSDITVKDYMSLKESAAAVEQTLKGKQKTEADTLRSLEEARRELEKLRKENQKLAQQSSSEVTAAQRRKAELEANLSAANRAKEEIEARLRDTKRQAEAEAAKLEAAAKVSREAEIQQKKAAEEANKKAAEAAEAAERARKQAEEAKARAEEAGKRELAAAHAAQMAKAGESEALANAVSARADAEEAAEHARKKIESAEREVSQTEERIGSITQSAGVAYQKNIQNSITPIRVTIAKKQLFGKDTRTFDFRGIPVQMGSERVVFLPVEQLGLDANGDAEKVTDLDISAGNAEVRKLYVRKGFPRIVAIVVPDTGPAAKSIASGAVSAFMPTLIAVRNGSRMGWGDRIRKLDRDYFLFQRDRLEPSATGLRYRTKGLRGTGDFAEYLLEGDQVVDLDGNFLGIVTSENEIVTIRNITDWNTVDLATKDARAAAHSLEETQ